MSHRHRHADATARLELGTAGSKDVGDHFDLVFGIEIVADVPEGVDTTHAFGGCQVICDGKCRKATRSSWIFGRAPNLTRSTRLTQPTRLNSTRSNEYSHLDDLAF